MDGFQKTDQELLQLLDEKMPEELSLEEIELLRQRMAESPALREALASQVHLESYLQTALARLQLSPAAIAARAREQQAGRGGLSLVLLILMIVVPAIAVVGVVAINAFYSHELAQKGNNSEANEKQGDEAGENKDPTKTPEQATDTQPKIEGGAIEDPTKADSPTKPAAIAPIKPAAPLPPPWQAVVESTVEPPAFQEVAFQTFDLSKEVVRRDQLQPWFEAAAGQNYRLHEVDTQFGRCGALEGLARLKSPWLNDSFLRMSLENYNKLQIHLFHGNKGVTLVYHQDHSYRWAAYTTTRKPKTARPETLALTATDDSRNLRTEMRFGGPIDLRFHNGQVVLSRGDIVLLAAPLPGPPDDVYFEGRATFYGLQLLRTSDAPALAPARKLVFETDRPADLPWTSSAPELAQPKKNDDGSLTFSADNMIKHVWCWTPLPQPGLQQVVFRLTNITPGVSVYLGRDQGHPAECVRFLKNRRNNRLVAKMRGVDDEHEIDLATHAESIDGAADNESCWLRLAFGCGTFRWWMSSDGVNWAQPDFIRESLPGKIDSIGILLVGKRPGTQVTLKRIELRELAALTNLAKADLRGKALALPLVPTLAAWQDEITKAKPAEVDVNDWRRACAVQTLAAGATKELSHPLLEMLLDDPATQQLPLADQLAVHEDGLQLVSDLRDGQSLKINLVTRLANVGLYAFQDRNLPPWSSIRRTFLSTPIHTLHRPAGAPLAAVEPLVRTELIQRAYAQQPQALLKLCEQLRFFHLNETVPMVTWAEALARRETATRAVASSGAPTIMRESWRPLLVEELSKEAYNLTSELQAVLESEAWEDAARIITSVDPEAAPGVSPYVKDRQLLTSLPVAVQLLLGDFPQLKEALGQRYGPLAKLRIGQAIAAGDSSAVELATVQFGATAESAEALRWLGDRALSNGWFEEAIALYQRAIERHPLLAGSLAHRSRLAAAMLGRDVGTPATSVVQFNDLKLDAAQFEALVTEMRARGTSAAVSSATHVMPGSLLAVPKPTAYASHNRSRLDGPVGDRPQEEVGRKTNQYQVPWPDRQLSTTIEGDMLYVTNRFQVAAYNLTNGQRQWQSQPPPGNIAKAQDWALIAMRPLVLRDQIITRQLFGKSPQIVCLEKSTGKLLWAADRGEREFFVSDPVYLHGQVVGLSMALQDQQEGQLRWNVLDPATGELQSQRDLIRLRSTWGSRACCEVLPLDHQLIVALGGITLALDGRGQVGWVRKQVTLPSDEDPRWVLQSFSRPLLVGGKVVMNQPGTRSVVCLDPATGLQHWETLLMDVVGCWGASRGMIVVQTESGVQTLDAATGKRRWFAPLTDLQPQALVDETAILVARRAVLPDNKSPAIQLVWLDPATGSQRATTLLPSLTDPLPRLGAMVPYKDRVFTFFGRGQHDPNRDVVELIPSGPVQ